MDPGSDFSLSDVFLGALVKQANCSMGLGLSNNLRFVQVCAVFACMCVFVFLIKRSI